MTWNSTSPPGASGHLGFGSRDFIIISDAEVDALWEVFYINYTSRGLRSMQTTIYGEVR